MTAYAVRVWNRDDDQAVRFFGPYRTHATATVLADRIEKRLVHPDESVEVVVISNPAGAVSALEADGWFEP